MKLLRKLTAFILVFSLIAGTVAVMSAAVDPTDETAVSLEDEEIAKEIPPEYEHHGTRRVELADTSATSYTPRLTAPAKTNKYYYSDINPFYQYGWGMPNCTCYAWGRAYEILGKAPNLSLYSAYLWYGYNKDNKIYSYGTTPKLGAIACWVYSSGTSGHVAVVEKIENNTITFSNSAYSGQTFYTSTAPVKDPSNGNKTWIFQGYIYIGDFVSNTTTTKTTTTAVTGDVYRITSTNGVNLRKGYGTGYAILGGIGYGKDVTVTKTKKNQGYTWGYTTYNGVSGWFVTDFAKLIYKKTASTTPAVQVPTTKPTVKATTAPTTKPTVKATTAPTTKPTVKATTAPTTKPTVKATTAPTTKPTVKATTAPTQAPTQAPTERRVPDKLEQATAAVPVRLMMGDLDGDKSLTILDATRIQLIVADLIIPTEYMLTVGDYDGDSNFSIMDASCLRYQLAYLDI